MAANGNLLSTHALAWFVDMCYPERLGAFCWEVINNQWAFEKIYLIPFVTGKPNKGLASNERNIAC